MRGPEKSRASATANATGDWKHVPKRCENQRDVEPGREVRGGREQHDARDGGGLRGIFKNKLVFVSSSSSSSLCFVVVRCCLVSLSLVYDVVKARTDRRGARAYI